jgi:hypothetical protein
MNLITILRGITSAYFKNAVSNPVERELVTSSSLGEHFLDDSRLPNEFMVVKDC